MGIIENLVLQLMKLPGVGRKSAQKLAFFIHAMPMEHALSLSDAIREVKEKAAFCKTCHNISDSERCPICADPNRQRDSICVVEEPSNILVVERSGGFKGLYHVLLGALSPSDGITPDRLTIGSLINRVRAGGVLEVIIATNPNTKGEITAQYIRDELQPFDVKVSRIAYGLPMGGDLEFADEVTLGKALEGRRLI